MGRVTRRPKSKPVPRPQPEARGSLSNHQRQQAQRQEQQQENNTNAQQQSQQQSKKIELIRTEKRLVREEKEDRKCAAAVEQWPKKVCYQWLHFCCHRCHCPAEKKQQFQYDIAQYSHDHYFHRTCCHNDHSTGKRANIALDRTIDRQLYDIRVGRRAPPPPPRPPPLWTETALYNFYKNYKRQESQLYNEDGACDPIQMLNSNAAYCRNRKWFQRRLKPRRNRPAAAVVLDLFGGMGTGMVVLKRLGIPISKLIHVDHDKIATHVHRTHYDPDYGGGGSTTGNNGNNHNHNPYKYIHYDEFEEVEENLDQFLQDHGPIDILLASPPGSDYTGANAKREGVYGLQGGYMVRLGPLIHAIQQRQQKRNHRLLFLVENVTIQNQTSVRRFDQTNRERIRQALGVSWQVDLNALYFSPCKRGNTFFTNIPVDAYDFEGKGSEIDPATCLNLDNDNDNHNDNTASGGDQEQETYCLPYKIFETDMIGKVNTLMASHSELDSDRMKVFAKVPDNNHNNPPNYKERYITSKERAALMGFPLWYLDPVDDLYTTLLDILVSNRHSGGLRGDDFQFHWKQKLPQQLHDFSGDFHGYCDGYRVTINEHVECVLQMCPPRGVGAGVRGTGPNKPPVYFTAEQYKKRLVGNTYSVPVVEHLLRPLVRLFPPPSDPPPDPRFQYPYPWATTAAGTTTRNTHHPDPPPGSTTTANHDTTTTTTTATAAAEEDLVVPAGSDDGTRTVTTTTTTAATAATTEEDAVVAAGDENTRTNAQANAAVGAAAAVMKREKDDDDESWHDHRSPAARSRRSRGRVSDATSATYVGHSSDSYQTGGGDDNTTTQDGRWLEDHPNSTVPRTAPKDEDDNDDDDDDDDGCHDDEDSSSPQQGDSQEEEEDDDQYHDLENGSLDDGPNTTGGDLTDDRRVSPEAVPSAATRGSTHEDDSCSMNHDHWLDHPNATSQERRGPSPKADDDDDHHHHHSANSRDGPNTAGGGDSEEDEKIVPPAAVSSAAPAPPLVLPNQVRLNIPKPKISYERIRVKKQEEQEQEQETRRKKNKNKQTFARVETAAGGTGGTVVAATDPLSARPVRWNTSSFSSSCLPPAVVVGTESDDSNNNHFHDKNNTKKNGTKRMAHSSAAERKRKARKTVSNPYERNI